MRVTSTLNRILFIILLVANVPAVGQVTVAENFDFIAPSPPAPASTWPNSDLPFGWTQQKINGTDPANVWERMNGTATFPVCTPYQGPAMMRYNARAIVAAGLHQAALISKPYDFTGYVAAGATVSFWMYRDNSYAGFNDNVGIYINNSPSMTGAVPLTGSTNPVNRPCASAPAVGCGANAWYQYTYNIPYPGYTTSATYIILMATSAQGGNIYIDRFTIDTWPTNQTVGSAPIASLNYQNTIDVGKNTQNNSIIGIKVNMDKSANPLAVDSINFNTVGTTLPGVATDFANAKVFYTGGSSTFTLTNAIQLGATNGVTAGAPYVTNMTFRPPTAATTISVAAGAGVYTVTVASTAGITVGSTLTAVGIPSLTKVESIVGSVLTLSMPTSAPIGAGTALTAAFIFENKENYLWLTYDIQAAATSGNYVDAEFLNVKLGAVNYTPSPQTALGARQIETTYCPGGLPPTYSVGTSWLSGSYTNNDYVRSVTLPGYAAVYPPGVTNIYNTVWGPQIPVSSCTFPTCRFACHPPDYEKFSPSIVGNTCTLMPDSTYTIGLQVGTWGSGNYIAAWIDFNKDAVFNNTLWSLGGEKIAQSGSLNNLGWYNTNFTVPSGAFIGTTTLRVREVYLGSNIDPCASATYGEVEDYKITVITPCAVAGWKVWLGFTDDWFTSTNWCGGVPTTINDNALIPGYGAAGYKRPVIRGATGAVCKKLRIEGTDTLYCDSYQGGSLTTADSLNIANSTGRLHVNSAYGATAVINNSNLYNGLYTILKQTVCRQKIQLVYSRTELLAKGLVAGDNIDQVIFNIIQRASYKTVTTSSPYTNFNINYYYTNPSFCFASTTYAPVAIAGGNVYSGTLNTGVIPYNTGGQITIPLSTPIVWNGLANSLVIEICYDLASAGSGVDRFEQTPTTGCNSTLVCFNLVAGVPAGCSLATGFGGTLITYVTNSRPNVSYHYTRPYAKFNINVGGATGGDWINNGSFVPAYSMVNFNGSAAQSIRGTTPTTFYDLKINNPSVAGVTQGTAITVTDSLSLAQGRLKLNGLTLTMNNPLSTAITRVSGFLQSENNPPNYGRLHWNAGSNLGLYTVPFGTAAAASVYIPFKYTATAGTNDMTYATYATPPNNTPIPTGVTHINGFYTGTDNSANMVDRYWQIDNAGVGGTGHMEFAYANTEIPANGNTNIRAQHWTNAITKWDDPNMFVGQSNPLTGPTVFSVLYSNSNRFGSWALTQAAQPLPIDLLSFNAKAERDRVRIFWTTASELNNDYFTVERTVDANEYSFIDKVKSQGNSNGLTDYYTYDYKPLLGTQYYRLKQTDNDGKYTYSQLVPVTFGKVDDFEIVSVSNNTNGSHTVYFKYDSENMLTYKLVDILGKLVFSKDKVPAIIGVNQIDLKDGIAPGVYTLVISDGNRMVSRKIFY